MADGGTRIQTYADAREAIPARRPTLHADRPSRRGLGAPDGAAIDVALRAAATGRHVPLPALSPGAMIHLQRTLGNAGVARLIVQRCAPGQVPDEGCAECGQPPVAQRATRNATVQRDLSDPPPAETAITEPAPAGEATPTGEGESTCQPATQGVAFKNDAFKVSFAGLEDLNKKVAGRLSGSAGHVNMAAMPTFSVTCWDGTGDSRTVGAAKVTAKGTATFPTPAEPDDSKWPVQSADRAREVQGIKDYFAIVTAHEQSHVKIYTDAYSAAAADLVGLTASAAKTKFNSIICESFKSQDSLDNAEGCMVVSNGKDAAKGKASECGLTPNAAASCP